MNKLQCMDLVVPTENFFKKLFRFAVWADRTRVRSFVDRHPFRRSKIAQVDEKMIR